jgi:RNA polymerase sigma-70 factor, ECF subfamily
VQEAVERGVSDALRRGRFDEAAALGLRGYGPEILGFLVAVGPREAEDAFSQFCEDLWRGLPGFRAHASFRTWAYALARHAAERVRRDPYTRRRADLSALGPISGLAEELRSSTATFLSTRVREGVARLREALPPEDRELLVLRVDRQMGYADIARVVLAADATEADVTKKAAALRKRYERLKVEIREQAERDGLVRRKAAQGSS